MMFVLTLAISRAVPLLLLFSALLMAGRFLYDRYRPWRPASRSAGCSSAKPAWHAEPGAEAIPYDPDAVADDPCSLICPSGGTVDA